MTIKHLKFIDTLPCLCCGIEGRSTHHHLLRVDNCYLVKKEGEEFFAFPKVKSKGMATKSDDRFTIPVCNRCHQTLHSLGNDKKALQELGFEKPEQLALTFFDKTGDFESCNRLIKDLRKWVSLGSQSSKGLKASKGFAG